MTKARECFARADHLASLSKFCLLSNKIILAFYGDRGSCIFSTGVVCDVLTHYGFAARPLRVEAAVFDTKPGGRGVSLGRIHSDIRRKTAGEGAWHGHLVSLVDHEYLIDTTLDQANDTEPKLRAEPVVIHLPTTDWFLCEDPKSYRYHRTGICLFLSGQIRPCATPNTQGKTDSSMLVIFKHVAVKILFRL